MWHAESPLVRTAPTPMMLLADDVRAAGYRVLAVERFGHDPAHTVTSNWPHLRDELLAARRPDLISCTIQGNGDGSTAVDYTVNSATGYPYVTGGGSPERPVHELQQLVVRKELKEARSRKIHHGRRGRGPHR